LVAQSQEIQSKIDITAKESDDLKTELDNVMLHIGNIVHDSVPVHHDEKFNEVVGTWGEPRIITITQKPGFCHHHQILHMIGGYDPKRGQKVAGHRGFFLTGPGALLNLALINYGIQFLTKKGYTPIQTPFFMKRHLMAATAQLSDFDEQLYRLESGEKTEAKDDCFLIATAEQPVSAFYADDWIEKEQLPIRFAGWSSCFRKEAGAHGKDVWGVFRVHQFEKVEQFCIVEGDKSVEEHEKMRETSEEFLKSLNLPYRVITY
jgi:seryl-tRNA synthetase